MIVVADTTPINYLKLIERVELLAHLYQRILIPTEVHRELLSPKTPAIVRTWVEHPPVWLQILTPAPSNISLNPALDAGERSAITLALELHSSVLLIDEAAGRTEALKHGLRVVGTLGVLRDAAALGLLDLRSAVADLQQTNFRIDPALIADILRRQK
jgi:predicted nucleic acid-binding protein